MVTGRRKVFTNRSSLSRKGNGKGKQKDDEDDFPPSIPARPFRSEARFQYHLPNPNPNRRLQPLLLLQPLIASTSKSDAGPESTAVTAIMMPNAKSTPSKSPRPHEGE
jgi:hypothetical protein